MAQAAELATGTAESVADRATAMAAIELPRAWVAQANALTDAIAAWLQALYDALPTSRTIDAERMPALHAAREAAQAARRGFDDVPPWSDGAPHAWLGACDTIMDELTRYELEREAVGALPPERYRALALAYNAWVDATAEFAALWPVGETSE